MRIGLAGVLAAFVAIIQRGLVAMMAVGDHQLLVGHGLLNSLSESGIGDGPQAVRDAKFVASARSERRVRAICSSQVSIWRARIVVEKKQLARLRARVAQQLDAVRFRAR